MAFYTGGVLRYGSCHVFAAPDSPPVIMCDRSSFRADAIYSRVRTRTRRTTRRRIRHVPKLQDGLWWQPAKGTAEYHLRHKVTNMLIRRSPHLQIPRVAEILNSWT
jgi:hypothetical protein